VRLPERTQLAFELGVIPVPGPVPLVPTFRFDLDLRDAYSPPMADMATCEPFWDGLQFIAPGLARVDFKQLALSPLFGPLPMPNARFSGDVQIGTSGSGFTLVVSELFYLPGLWANGSIIPIPIFAEPDAPYVEDLCVDLRLAGFGLHFDLQRPFPRFDPLGVLELLGLLADPLGYPIDPRGALAEMVRAAVVDLRVELPPLIAKWFPPAAALAGQRRSWEINLGTFLTAVQGALRGLKWGLDAAHALATHQTTPALLEAELQAQLSAMLQALPPEARTLSLSGELAGFAASATFALLAPDQVAAELQRRDAPALPPRLTPHWGAAAATEQLEGWEPRWKGAAPPPAYSPTRAGGNVFATPAFAHVSAQDWQALQQARAAPAGQAALMLAADVKLWGIAGASFFGWFAEDGSLAAVSSGQTDALPLGVLGVREPLGLQAQGRLVLWGGPGGATVTATVATAADWAPVPWLSLRIAAAQASLTLRSDRTFHVHGALSGSVGAAQLTGSLDVTEQRCQLQTQLHYAAGQFGQGPIVAFDATLDGSIAAGPRLALAGQGTLQLFGQSVAGVEVALDGSRASLKATVQLPSFGLGGALRDVDVFATVAGSIDLGATAPTFDLRGLTTLRLFSHTLTAEGEGGIYALGGAPTVFASGKVRWADRDWFSAELRVSPTEIILSGQTTLSVELGQASIGNLQLARAVAQLNLGGTLTLDATGAPLSFNLSGAFVFGVAPAGSSQVFPIAVDRCSTGAAVSSLDLALVDLGALLPIPSTFSIPLPDHLDQDTDRPPLLSFEEPVKFDPGSIAPPALPSLDLEKRNIYWPKLVSKDVQVSLPIVPPSGVLHLKWQDGDFALVVE
jgi:hypothetical protein